MHFHKYKDLYLPERISTSMGVSGEYRAVLMEQDGTVVHDSGWIKNLVTDNGLLVMTTQTFGSWASNIHIGSGSTPPAVTDTQLASLLGSTSNGLQSEVNGGSPNYEAITTTKGRFGAGNGTGTVREFGVGYSATSICTRALLTTPIVKSETQVLDLFFRFTAWPDLTDKVGTVNIAGETYNYTSRVSQVDKMNYTTGVWAYGNWCTTYTGEIGAVTEAPSGAMGSGSDHLQTEDQRQQGRYQCSQSFGLDKANDVLGIRSVSCDFALNRSSQGYDGIQVRFGNVVGDTTIPKDNTKTIRFDFEWTWGRRP